MCMSNLILQVTTYYVVTMVKTEILNDVRNNPAILNDVGNNLRLS